MKPFRVTLLLALIVSTSGCYHATVTTGLTPSTVVIDQTFAAGWIYGLVPPKTVATAAQCPGGVAIVETELSFVNQLVSFLTLGIYTPMHIKVTCAMAGSSSLDVAIPQMAVQQGANRDDVIEAFSDAADQAVGNSGPVYVRFETVSAD